MSTYFDEYYTSAMDTSGMFLKYYFTYKKPMENPIYKIRIPPKIPDPVLFDPNELFVK